MVEPKTKEPTTAAPIAKPYFHDTGLATKPGAALAEEVAVEFLVVVEEEEAVTEEAVTEEAATTPVETKAVLVETEVELEDIF